MTHQNTAWFASGYIYIVCGVLTRTESTVDGSTFLSTSTMPRYGLHIMHVSVMKVMAYL